MATGGGAKGGGSQATGASLGEAVRFVSQEGLRIADARLFNETLVTLKRASVGYSYRVSGMRIFAQTFARAEHTPREREFGNGSLFARGESRAARKSASSYVCPSCL